MDYNDYIAGRFSIMKEINKKVGVNIRKFRTAQGLTQEKLADLADVHFKYIGALERGEYNSSIAVLYKIAKALNIPLEQLCSFTPSELPEREKVKQKIIGVLSDKNEDVLNWYLDVFKAADKLQEKIKNQTNS